MIGEGSSIDASELAARITVDADTGVVTLPEEVLDRLWFNLDRDPGVTNSLNQLEIKKMIGSFGVEGVLSITRAVSDIGSIDHQSSGGEAHA